MKNKFNSDKLIKNVSNNQLFLDYDELAAINQSAKEVQEAIAEEILNYDGIAEVYTAHSMKTQHYTEGMAYMLQKDLIIKDLEMYWWSLTLLLLVILVQALRMDLGLIMILKCLF